MIHSRSTLGILALFATLASGPVFAAGNGRANTPEYYYQPNVNNFSVSLAYEQFTPNALNETTNAGTKVSENTHTHSGYLIDGSYGLSDAWAFGIATSMLNDQVDYKEPSGVMYSEKAEGVSDIVFKLTNITTLSAWNLHVGIAAALSPGKHKIPQSWANGDEMTGGTTITNYVGMSTAVGGTNYFGFKAQYVTRTERTINNNSTTNPQDFRLSGGNTFLLGTFFEFTAAEFSADANAFIAFNDPTTITYADGGLGSLEASRNLGLGAGIQYQFLPNANFRIAYDIRTVPEDKSSANVRSGYNESLLTARARMEF